MSQQSLTSDAPRILDATCSYRKIWPKFATVRIDIRPETRPDIVMDAKALRFPNRYFDKIYCDPPHLFNPGKQTLAILHRRQGGRMSPTMFQRYGWWNTRKEWLSFIQATNEEFSRCLKDDGILEYKILDGKGNGTTHLSELLSGMFHFVLIKDREKKSKTSFGKSSTKCHFLTFRKR